MIKCLVSCRKTKSSKASQCLTTAVHQLIHLMLAAAVRHTCCRLFLPFAIKRTQYQVPVWLLSLVWFKKEKEQRACNQIPNHLVWQRWAIALKAKSTELGRGNEKPAKCSDGAEYSLGTLMFTVTIKSRAGRLLLCPSLLPFNSVVKKKQQRMSSALPRFQGCCRCSCTTGALAWWRVYLLYLSSHYTATALLADLCRGFIRAVCTKFHQSFLHSLGSHGSFTEGWREASNTLIKLQTRAGVKSTAKASR